MRIHLKPKFRGTARPRRTYSPFKPGNGRGCWDHGTLYRRTRDSRVKSVTTTSSFFLTRKRDETCCDKERDGCDVFHDDLLFEVLVRALCGSGIFTLRSLLLRPDILHAHGQTTLNSTPEIAHAHLQRDTAAASIRDARSPCHGPYQRYPNRYREYPFGSPDAPISAYPQVQLHFDASEA